MKKIASVAVILILGIFAQIGGVEAWNGWTSVTIHEVQFDETNYYAPVDMHDMNNNSPLLISVYLNWENETLYFPIVEDSLGNDFIPIIENESGYIYIELQHFFKIKKEKSDIIAIPILAYSDPLLGDDILNLPVLGNTNPGGHGDLGEPPLDYYIMIPLKKDHEDSYVAYLLEDPNSPNGKPSDFNWVIPLIRIPSSSLEQYPPIDAGDWDIEMDIGLFLDYVSINPNSG